MRCKFIRWNNGWWRVIESIDELVEESQAQDRKIANAVIGDITGEATGKDEELCDKIKSYAIATEQSVLTAIPVITSRKIKNQLDSLLSGEVILVNERGGYNSIKLNGEELIISKEGHTFPQYTKDDIRVKQFGIYERSSEYGVRHWYAWVGNTEVRNGDTLKWDTYSEAYGQAMRYVN